MKTNNIENENWNCPIEDGQSYDNWLESKLINIIYTLAPYEMTKPTKNSYKENEKTTRLNNCKGKYLQKWRQNRRLYFKSNIIKNTINNYNKQLQPNITCQTVTIIFHVHMTS